MRGSPREEASETQEPTNQDRCRHYLNPNLCIYTCLRIYACMLATVHACMYVYTYTHMHIYSKLPTYILHTCWHHMNCRRQLTGTKCTPSLLLSGIGRLFVLRRHILGSCHNVCKRDGGCERLTYLTSKSRNLSLQLLDVCKINSLGCRLRVREMMATPTSLSSSLYALVASYSPLDTCHNFCEWVSRSSVPNSGHRCPRRDASGL